MYIPSALHTPILSDVNVGYSYGSVKLEGTDTLSHSNVHVLRRLHFKQQLLALLIFELAM